MSLITSISGIRGTIGGLEGNNLTTLDIVKFTAAYSSFLKKRYPKKTPQVVVGRDGRISGEMIRKLVVGTLLSQGIGVIDLALATTPTVEIMITKTKAQGGVIITASHNPVGWNALKFLNYQGEFLSASAGKLILKLAKATGLDSVSEEKLGTYTLNSEAANWHIKAVLKLALVKPKLIAAKKFKVVVDGINSVGGVVIPELLKSLGLKNVIKLNCIPNGKFSHSPEPLDQNLAQIKARVIKEKADLGIVVDPDVDRLAFIDEQGKMFGEEYTLVAVAEYVLKNYNSKFYSKNTVSNLSSSRALVDISKTRGATYYAAAVGEVNVVEKMKKVRAVIGGEGNGGIIYPEFHYGRDALVGVALFLSSLALSNKTMSEFRKEFPAYFMLKAKIKLTPKLNLTKLLAKLKKDYVAEKITTIDGLKIDWKDSWLHLRASNTEPVIRIYAEAPSLALAKFKVAEIKKKIRAYTK